MANSIMIKLSVDKYSSLMGIRTYDRKYGSHGRFLIAREALRWMLGEANGTVRYHSDCGNYAEVWHNGESLWFHITWLSLNGDGAVKGFQQTFSVPDGTVAPLLNDGGNAKLLYTPIHAPVTIKTSPVAAKMIRRIVQNKHLRRAFSKAMRDCFNWPGDHITLHKDGKYSFYFTTRSGYPKCGGLVLHESTRNGYPYIYYSVHT